MAKTHLIFVPCHSVWNSLGAASAEENLGQSPNHWYLAPFQYEGRDHLAFIKHAVVGVETLLNDLDHSILLFSGSQTKRSAGNVSESQSYYFLIWKLLQWIRDGKAAPEAFQQEKTILHVCDRILGKLIQLNITLEELFTEHISTEEFALDSFENLLFSICRFYELAQQYPSQVIIVGFGFKKERFVKYHAESIDYPVEQVEYISIEPKPQYADQNKIRLYFEDLKLQEKKNALELFKSDWYGTKHPLHTKKSSRNPFNRVHGYILPLDLNQPVENDKEYFLENIKGKMPWSK